MHVIWKRPDGFHNAQPEDFRRVALSNGAQLWLHRREIDWYPFQVSGDWDGQEQTVRLNRLVNLLDGSDSAWKDFLEHYHDDDLGSGADVSSAAKSLHVWLENMKGSVKGNAWELDIIQCALGDIQKRILSLA